MSGPRYFALACRLPAYSGVMAARIESEREEEDPSQAPPLSARQASGGGKREIPMAAFMAEFPGMISTGSASPAVT